MYIHNIYNICAAFFTLFRLFYWTIFILTRVEMLIISQVGSVTDFINEA